MKGRTITLDRTVRVGPTSLSLGDLLLGDGPAFATPLRRRQLAAARARVLEAGVAALEEWHDDHWHQFNIRPNPEAMPALYSALHRLGTKLISQGSATNLWFLYKPPGIRMRLEADDPAVVAGAARRLRNWVRAGIIDEAHPATYEPETYLFGGKRSMAHVHAQFTADSMAWLELRRRTVGEAEPPAWAISLVMLRSLFTAFGVADWEDLDVWKRVVERTGRKLPDVVDSIELGAIAEDIQHAWQHPEELRRGLPTNVRRVVDRHADASQRIGAAWLAGPRPDSFSHGPRALLALLVIFHWNRAGLTMSRQSIIAEALLRRRTV